MKTMASVHALIAELNGDMTELKRLQERNLTAWSRIEHGANDPIDWGALGFTIHSLYGIFENYFLRVSHFFENNLPSDKWHKVLVEKMALDLPPIRPALLDRAELKSLVLELLKFRHRFRNLYGEDLDPAKTSAVQLQAARLLAAFPEVHSRFLEKLQSIAQGLP